jgi:hypothetical protein
LPDARAGKNEPVRDVLRSASAACVPSLLLLLPATAGAGGAPPNPCVDPDRRAQLRCPDLQVSKPFDLVLDPFARPGRLMLRAGNSIDSIGRGPAELFGVRIGARLMRARQRIYRRRGGRIGIDTGARLVFKPIPGQGAYWKLAHAARFELWKRDRRGRRVRLARVGPKVSYCLRDLDHSRPRLRGSPRRVVYPSCNQSPTRRKVAIGTSVGWSDVYPASYHEQWINVTGLRGCFDYVHTADPRNGIYESNERNNSAFVTIRLPFRPGPQRCPRKRRAQQPRQPQQPREPAPKPKPKSPSPPPSPPEYEPTG